MEAEVSSRVFSQDWSRTLGKTDAKLNPSSIRTWCLSLIYITLLLKSLFLRGFCSFFVNGLHIYLYFSSKKCRRVFEDEPQWNTHNFHSLRSQEHCNDRINKIFNFKIWVNARTFNYFKNPFLFRKKKEFVRDKSWSDQIGYEDIDSDISVNIPKSIGKNMTHSNNLISKRYREASYGGQLG